MSANNQAEYKRRLQTVSGQLAKLGQDLLLVTPGADLKYLTGYDALPLERLTCLAINAQGESWMIVPTLEKPSALAHGIPELNIELLDWTETQNPYELFAAAVGKPKSALINNLMWAEKAWYLQDAFKVNAELANKLIADLRAVKSDFEMDALIEAGAAIDLVHNRIGEWLRPGRTEREVGRDIANAIIESGHAKVDFVIVGSGTNGASPHHELSDRVINANEPVVIDIGGTMPSGYCSDSTRTYVTGKAPAEFAEHYAALKEAQSAASSAANAGATCESVDAVARNVLTNAGLGEKFIHRVGHGIGLETHEDPYLVAGNKTVLAEGHAFSVEPGFYFADKFGARIEDILVVRNGQGVSANNTSRELIEL